MFLKKTITLFSAAVLLALGAKAQKHADTVVNGTVYHYVEQMPEFPGGISGIGSYLSDNIHYPDSARNANIQGKVVIKFAVNTDGSISDATVLKSVGWGLDEEALRLVKIMPKWKPGVQDGKLVKVYYTLPISFKLEDPAPDEKKNE